jgi:transcriptional regulator with XRE-family HTH domain
MTNAHILQPVDLDVAHRIKAKRRAARLSQTELGEALGVTHSAIYKYEAGTAPLSASKLATIADALHVSVSDLFGEGDRPARFRGTSGELTLLELYRRLSPDQQAAVIALLKSFASGAP